MVKCKKIIRRPNNTMVKCKKNERTNNTMVKCKKIMRGQTIPWLNVKR